MKFQLRQNTLLLTVAGSRAYGTHTPASDLDIKGVCVPPKQFYLGTQQFQQCNDTGEIVQSFMEDIPRGDLREAAQINGMEGTVFELRRFLDLASGANPNILDILFCRDEDVLLSTPEGLELRTHRDRFLTKKCLQTFLGYAKQQADRIATHRKYLLNPPTHIPTREEFGLPERNGFPQDQVLAAMDMIRKQVDRWNIDFVDTEEATKIFIQDQIAKMLAEIQIGTDTKWTAAGNMLGYDTNFMQFIHQQRQYDMAVREHQAYQTWKKERNVKRAGMESTIGYDCYSEDTEFLTDSGWRLFDQVTETDRLATIFLDRSEARVCNMGVRPSNLTWGCVEYQKPLERFDGTYTGNMYHYTGNHTDTLVTANHRMLTRHVEINNDKAQEWSLKEAASLGSHFDFLRTITPRKKNYSNKQHFEGLPISPPEYLKLMGWFLSDGTVLFQGGKVSAIHISQKQGGKLSAALEQFILESAEIANASLYAYWKGPNGFRSMPITEQILSVRGPVIRERIYADCGHSKEKRIPRWVFGLSKRLMEYLLDGLMGGDGTVRKTSFKSLIYYSSVKGLADDVNELAFHCGFETSLWGPYKYAEEDPEMWQVHVNKNIEQHRRLTKSVNLAKIPVVGQRIVCFSVPNGTLVTRRNGRIGLHGNCKHGMHLARLIIACRTIFETGTLEVYNPDPWLRDIRDCKVSYEDLMAWVGEQKEGLTALAVKSSLPSRVDSDWLDDLAVRIISKHLGM